jgi:hypothetical protein
MPASLYTKLLTYSLRINIIEANDSPIAGMYSHVWGYDGSNPSDPWRLCDPARPEMSDLLTIEPDKATTST